MGLPPANLVLFFLSAFVGLWGLSVAVRGARGGRAPRTRVCPQCGGSMLGVEGRRCPGCEFEAAREEELQEPVAAQGVVCVGLVAIVAGVVLVPFALVVRSWETPLDAESLHPLHAVFAGVGAFGLALAAWGWRGEPARGRRRCPRCWYDMSRLRGGAGEAVLVCPECGHDARVERRLYRARRRRWVVRLGVVLVVVGWLGQTAPRGLREGWLGLVPTTVLIAGAEWLPTELYQDSASPFSTGVLTMRLIDETWDWQRRWAVEKMTSIAMRSDDPARINAAIMTLAPQDDRPNFDLVERVLRLLADRAGREWNPAEQVSIGAALDAYWGHMYAGARQSHGWPEDLVTALLHAGTAETVEQACVLLLYAEVPVTERVAELLWRHAKSSMPTVANEARHALALLLNPESGVLETWLSRVRGSDAEVRALAAAIPGSAIRIDAAVCDGLIELVCNDPDPTVALAAMESLARTLCTCGSRGPKRCSSGLATTGGG